MNEALRRDLDRFAEENYESIFRDIGRLVAIVSVEGEPAPGAPFGPGPKAALDLGLQIARELGLEAVNCEDKIGYALLGGPDERYIATITHLDVVPTGDGWEHDPFTMREREGWIIGRGVMDDKGPSVLCFYALKYLKERQIPLRYPIRALLGANEESGMGDVEHYLANYPAPLFCFSPDANFPLCNGEKGIYHGRIRFDLPLGNIVDIRGGIVVNAVPDKAEATVRAAHLEPAERVAVEELEPGLWHVTASGLGGHASLPKGTVNAIGVLVDYLLSSGVCDADETRMFTLLQRLHSAWDGSGLGVQADDGRFEPLTIIGGMIGLEDGKLFQTLDSRYPTNTSGAQIAATIQALAGDMARVTVDRDAPPFYMSLDDPAVQVCIDAYNAVTGENAAPYTIGGGTDARDFPRAVSFGPEHPERPMPDFAGPIHGVDEAASKDYLIEALKVYILALIRLEELEL
ncbi:MAG: Sapep family Mn(2+)-dependent dipeptidase [Oscillospiraceae bacterium]|nr:Sapep family Mn(2+)-dependent dipeptidase [Oscillospiraceae bacterium]